MAVVTVEKDFITPSMTMITEVNAPLERLWDAHADPRQLERFWGPPDWPARFSRHDMAEGGESLYYMNGPDGEISRGFWRFTKVDPGQGFTVRDSFLNPDGSVNTDLPSMRMSFQFTRTPNGSMTTCRTFFHSADQFRELLKMGAEEGSLAAIEQVDEVLADADSFERHTAEIQILNESQIRVNRIILAGRKEVWQAHHDPDLLRRWMLGPDGWTMPVCEVGAEVGDSYRYEWELASGGERFGFTGKILSTNSPYREVTTEHMIGDENETINELTLTELSRGTLLTLVITYPSEQLRDAILATGMVEGMEESYQRLETQLA